MMGGESKKLIFIIISTSRLIANLDDKFYKQKLISRMPDLLDSYLEFKNRTSVAQYKESYYRFKFELDNLLETVDYILYSNIYKDTPLLNLKRRILNLKLYLIKSIKKSNTTPIPKEEKATPPPVDKIELKPNITTAYKERPISSREKILDFIKKSRKIRTKDLVEEFSALSERTVKRTLKDLTDHGILKREESDRAVYYSVIN